MIALTMAMALASPALGQDSGFTPAATEACLERTPASVACVGLSAAVCIAGPDGGSNAGMGACWGQEAAYWQARLDTVLERLSAEAAESDAFLDEARSSAARQAPALDQMRAAFVAYREALCTFRATTWGGGSGAGPAYSECWMTATGVQALLLEAGASLR